MSAPKKEINWEALEIDYRAGIRSLKDIGTEYGVSDAGIIKKAKKEGWTRDLKAKIVARAEAKVSEALVSASVSADKTLTEKAVIEATAEVIARADLINREDVDLALQVSRSQLRELAALGNPEFVERLEWLGQIMDQSGEDDAGKQVQDKANEMYRYIISLAGRVKMAKEIAGSHGVYIPMQRKILKLDEEADKNQAQLDSLLAKINAGA